MATLSTDDHESIRQISAWARYLVENYWRLKLVKDRWHKQGGLLETITQADLNNAGLTDISVDDLKDVEFWFTVNVTDHLDDAIGTKLNKIGENVP